MTAPRKVGVFWDLENVQIPKGQSARELVELVRSNVFPKGRMVEEVTFEAYLDVVKLNEKVALELRRANVKLVHVPGGDKNGADIRIIQEVNDFWHFHENCIIILISSDENFLPLAGSLRRQPLVTSYLIHAKHINAALKEAFDESFEWPALTRSKAPPAAIKSLASEGKKVEKQPAAASSKEIETGRGLKQHQRDSTPSSNFKKPDGKPSANPQSDGEARFNHGNNGTVNNKYGPAKQLENKSRDSARFSPAPKFEGGRDDRKDNTARHTEKDVKSAESSRGKREPVKSAAVGNSKPSAEAGVRHQKSTAHVKKFVCFECNREFASESSLENHQTSTGHSNTFPCGQCDREFASEQGLDSHQKATGHSDMFTCSDCDRKFASEKALKSHQEATGHSDMFPCGQCDREFASEQALESHQKATGHSDVFSCDDCGRRFASEKALDDHQDATGHSNMFSCDGCDREFASEQALESHQKATGHYNVHSCATCGKQFVSDEALEKHEEATGHSAMLSCSMCDREFASEQALVDHVKATGHVNPFDQMMSLFTRS